MSNASKVHFRADAIYRDVRGADWITVQLP
jgi:hypothetical protein